MNNNINMVKENNNINMVKEFKNPSYLQSSATMLLYFCSWGIWWSFFQIWLTNSLNMSGAKVGTVFSANSFVTLILMIIYGGVQDRLGIKKNLAIFCSLLSVFVGPFFIFFYGGLLRTNFVLGVSLGSILLSTGFLSATALYESLSERLSRNFDFEYGHVRMFGSLGYAISAILAGFLFVINPDLNFIVSSLLGFLLLMNLIFWNPEKKAILKNKDSNLQSEKAPSIKDMLEVLKLPAVWKIIIFVVLSWTFYTVFDQQMFPQFYTRLFTSPADGEQMYGILNSLEVFGEAIMMGIVPFVMRKIGVRNTLLLGVGVMFVRIGGCGIARGVIAISLIKMLHSIEVPLFMLSIIRYFTIHFDTRLSSTLYMIGFQVAAQVGQLILSTPLGYLRDSIGYSHTFLVIAGIVFLAVVYSLFALKSDDEDVGGDPFVRSIHGK